LYRVRYHEDDKGKLTNPPQKSKLVEFIKPNVNIVYDESDIQPISDQLYQKIKDNINAEYYSVYKVEGEDSIRFNRKKKSLCGICKLYHEGDNMSLSILCGNLYLYCFRAGRSELICNIHDVDLYPEQKKV